MSNKPKEPTPTSSISEFSLDIGCNPTGKKPDSQAKKQSSNHLYLLVTFNECKVY